MPLKRTRLSRLALAALLLPLLSLGRPASAGPGVSTTPAAKVVSVSPDYGGRNGALGSALDDGGAGAAPLNPLAQAGRALEALVIVLIVVAGGLVLLKRSGLLKGDGTLATPGSALRSFLPSTLAARDAAASASTDGTAELLTLLGSQTLPHSPGAGLHLVAVGGRVLLLGATGQAVTLLTEVTEFDPALQGGAGGDTPEESAAFAEYLARVGVAPPAPPGAGVTQRTLSAATDRLQSLVDGRGK